MLAGDEFWLRLIPALNSGFIMTVGLIVPSAFFGFILGVIVGALRVFGSPKVRWLADSYVAVIRGVPLLLQLYFLYYVMPRWGIVLSPYFAAIIGFIMCNGAYHSEYIRGALLSIRQGQIKAASALGFTRLQMVTHIIIPQAVRRALPGCGNEVIYLIKYSSLAHMLTYIELTGVARDFTSSYFRYTEVYLSAGFYYLVLTTLAAWLLHKVETRIAIPGFGYKSAA